MKLPRECTLALENYIRVGDRNILAKKVTLIHMDPEAKIIFLKF